MIFFAKLGHIFFPQFRFLRKTSKQSFLGKSCICLKGFVEAEAESLGLAKLRSFEIQTPVLSDSK